VIDWGKAFQVAFVGFSGVFVGLVLLEICVNLLSRVVRVIERSSISMEK
jgi:Na+-transporting methylmalonyl-CoA/oxaloacetate decarboxylase gamma subunit